jgi:hypothetical protein
LEVSTSGPDGQPNAQAAAVLKARQARATLSARRRLSAPTSQVQFDLTEVLIPCLRPAGLFPAPA